MIAFLLIVLGALHGFMPVPLNYAFTPRSEFTREYKELGLWLRDNAPEVRGNIMLARKPQVPFYAEARFDLLPKGLTVEGLATYMDTNSISYVIADERHFRNEYPELLTLLEPTTTALEFKPLHRVDYMGYTIIAYKYTPKN